MFEGCKEIENLSQSEISIRRKQPGSNQLSLHKECWPFLPSFYIANIPGMVYMTQLHFSCNPKYRGCQIELQQNLDNEFGLSNLQDSMHYIEPELALVQNICALVGDITHRLAHRQGSYLDLCCLVYSQRAMAPLTWTLSDLMTPNWGISMQASRIWIMSTGMPSFSRPRTRTWKQLNKHSETENLFTEHKQA